MYFPPCIGYLLTSDPELRPSIWQMCEVVSRLTGTTNHVTNVFVSTLLLLCLIECSNYTVLAGHLFITGSVGVHRTTTIHYTTSCIIEVDLLIVRISPHSVHLVH